MASPPPVIAIAKNLKSFYFYLKGGKTRSSKFKNELTILNLENIFDSFKNISTADIRAVTNKCIILKRIRSRVAAS